MLDNAISGDGKEFFTIATANENTFFLIIDRQREQQNVYFLTPATEDDLWAFLSKPPDAAKYAEHETMQDAVKEEAVAQPAEAPAPELLPEEPATPNPSQKDIIPALVGLTFLLLAGVGGFYYIEVWKPKKAAASNLLFSELLDEDDELLFADEDEIDEGK